MRFRSAPALLLLTCLLLALPSCGSFDSWIWADPAAPPTMTEQEVATALQEVQAAAVADLEAQGLTPETATPEQARAAMLAAGEAYLKERAALFAAQAPKELSPVATAILGAVQTLNPGWGTAASALAGLLVLLRKDSRQQAAVAIKAAGSAVQEITPYDGRVNGPEALQMIARAGGALLQSAVAAVTPKGTAPVAPAAPQAEA